ncbi:MAG: GyrI-like domain-containing protein [Promethearchaeota archaeon]
MPAKQKFDYKKRFPDLYRPSSKEPTIVDVPPMKFWMIDGKGDPNNSKSFQEAIKIVYSASYTLKMKIVIKENPSKDYVVPPLEGLWWTEGNKQWSMENRDNWYWTIMIRIPDFVTELQIEKALNLLNENDTLKEHPSLKKLRIETYNEGLSVQILHIGPYSAEIQTLKKLDEFIEKNGYIYHKKHHEIYLSDPRRTKPQNLKTILRHPIKKE